MKPRTKIEKKLCEMAAKLPALTEAQRRYAVDKFKNFGFYNKGEVWCTRCGKLHMKPIKGIKVSDVVCGYACPICGHVLEIKQCKSGKNVYCDGFKYAVVQTVKEWTVVRCFDVERSVYRGGNVDVYFTERFQCWLDECGKEYITGKQYSRSIYGIKWMSGADGGYDIKKHNASANGYYIFDDMFDASYYIVYPRMSVNPIYKRNGWNKEFLRLKGVSVVKLLQSLHNPQFEFLVKTKQYGILAHLINKGCKDVPYMHAVKVCNRNGYVVKDASLWYDYLDCLTALGKDTHNAFYVCPENLNKAHDKYYKKKLEKAERARKEEIAKRAAAKESTYMAAKGKYFGICFGNEDIVITVIQSVAEMREEGKIMHHCVFANEYYDKADSLILSAKDKAGKRIEAIEVSLSTFKVVQSRGVCNTNSERHDEILKLVNENMNLIKQVA